MTMTRHENGAMWAVLPDGQRQHMQHGPIDLIVQAYGDAAAVSNAHAAAWARFPHVLPELVAELALLRTPLGGNSSPPNGLVARNMVAVCGPYLPAFVTPMAAVAGAVADEVLVAMTAAADLERAFVNNGGDIAFMLADGQSLSTGIVADQNAPALDAFAELHSSSPARGIATSGWKGRSYSLGIADGVTVLARTAATADVAATLIANATNANDPAIYRQPASDLDEDTDLGDRLVTVEVGTLAQDTIQAAIDAGAASANHMLAAGLIEGAFLSLQGETRVAGEAAAQPLLAAE
jgi:ApbE superfamily uncharacterized protein (UPF0280 family)